MDAKNYLTIQGWMRTELNLKGNDLLVYAIIYGYSQSENQRFTGSLQYLADWCGATKQGIQKNLKNLLELGLIEKSEKEINGVKFCEYSCTLCNSVVQGMQLSCTNNLENKKVYNKNNSKELLETGEKKKLIQKPNLYQKCTSMILDATQNTEFRNILFNYLSFRLEIKDKPLYANQWKGMLNKLEDLYGGDIDLGIAIVQQSLDRGYLSFFPISGKVAQQPKNQNISYYDDEEYMKQQEDWLEERRKHGQRTEY